MSPGSSPTLSNASISSPLSLQISIRVLDPAVRTCLGYCRTSSAKSGSKVCNSWKGIDRNGKLDCLESRVITSVSFASSRNVLHLAEASCAAIVI